MTDRVVNVRDDAEHNRFLVDLDGDPAQLVYDTEPGRLILVHTEVPMPARVGGSADSSSRRPCNEHARRT